ncbi:NAD-dependent epimerase/dehydratase family protein [candidate division WOR-3 bacterium]|nr:NAD-dependent epimerase/dehydratase family protein [candidate division WOR-3 bacterium]
MKNKVIVTGGAGFIGSHLVDRLISMGMEVLIIDNLSSGSEENLNKMAEFLKKDICDDDIDAVIKKYSPSFIFHLAAQIDVRKSLADPLWDEGINIRGTLNLLEAATKTNIKKFIFSSTGGAIYGEAKYADEELLPNPLSPYGVAKLCCEHYLRIYSEWKNVPFTSLRYGNVYGPRQDPYGEAGVVAIFCNQLIEEKRPVLFGYGSMIRDYIYVSDIIEANILSMNGGDGEIYNIGTGTPTTVKELFLILKDISGKNLEPELAEAREGEISKIYLNCKKAKKELRWTSKVSLKKGLKDTYHWFVTHSE